MPGTGTKQKKTTVPVSTSATAATAATVIIITQGAPSPSTVTITSGTRIIFINDDNVGYAVEMSSNGNSTPVEVVLPALASVTVVAAATNGKKTVDYTLTSMQQAQGNLAVRDAAGGGRIIINP